MNKKLKIVPKSYYQTFVFTLLRDIQVDRQKIDHAYSTLSFLYHIYNTLRLPHSRPPTPVPRAPRRPILRMKGGNMAPDQRARGCYLLPKRRHISCLYNILLDVSDNTKQFIYIMVQSNRDIPHSEN